MHRLLSLCALLSVVSALFPVVVDAAPPPFPDMNDSWFAYQDAVAELKKEKVITGDPDGNFRPKDTINRAEFTKIVFRNVSNTEPISGDACFSDVPVDSWFAPYVCAASRRNIIGGYPDGSFKPEQPINFAEAVKILMRVRGDETTERAGEQWYLPYVTDFEEKGILPRAAYLAWEPLNRERAADLLVRIKRFEEKQDPGQSKGCGKDFTEAPSFITVDEVDRSFLLTVPKNYIAHDSFSLIVAFHGRTNDNARVRSYYGLDKNISDSFIVYPLAQKNGSSFSYPVGGKNGLGEIKFFDALVKELSNRYCIDMDKIYVVGHSLGAWFANTVACIRGDVVRASATVGGDGMLTKCSGQTGALMLHNPKDNLAPISSTEKERDLRLEENACKPDPVPATDMPDEFRCVRYSCSAGNDVYWCPHTIDTERDGTYYPHTWPSQMGREIAKFFRGL